MLKASNLMRDIIGKLAACHGVDLAAASAHLRLEMPPYQPLVIEKTGRHLVSVAHYFEQNGDLVQDPDVVFYTGIGDPTTHGKDLWIPIELQNSMGYKRWVYFSADGSRVESYYPRMQNDLAKFCNTWAKNIKEQGWLAGAVSKVRA